VKEGYIVLAILGIVLIAAIALTYTPDSITGQQVAGAQMCRTDADCKSDACQTGKCAATQGRIGRCEYTQITCAPQPCKKAIACNPVRGCRYEAMENMKDCGQDMACCNGECMGLVMAYDKCAPKTQYAGFTTRDICEELSQTKARKIEIDVPSWIKDCIKIADHVDWGFIYQSIRDR
jgi:hypothetical protein